MASSDIFFEVHAKGHVDRVNRTFKLPHNSKWFCRGTDYNIAEGDLIASRETTPAVEPEVDEYVEDRLIVRFSDLWDTELEGRDLKDGVRFGTDTRRCHVLLGGRGTPGVSSTHFTIYVDDQLRLFLRDDSRHGTAVEGNGRNRSEVRTRELWVLTNIAGETPIFEELVVHVGKLALGLTFPNHACADQSYKQNLGRLVRCRHLAIQGELGGIADVTLGSDPTTVAPSGSATPRAKNIYIDAGEIGRGVFGVVSLVIQSRTGNVYAQKQLLRVKPSMSRVGEKRQRSQPRDDAEKLRITQLQEEYKVLATFGHPNVIQVHEFQEDPPVIIMDYCEFGNLRQPKATMHEDLYMTAFAQVLSGLEHMHSAKIVHRDLKPENILISSQSPFKVVIADFGLAKAMPPDAMLQTFCGTPTYAAPEVLTGSGHGPKADVWSLGVMGMEWIYGLPPRPRQKSIKFLDVTWTNHLLAKLREEEDCDFTDLLLCMLELQPSERWSSFQCRSYGETGERLFRMRSDDVLAGIRDSTDDITVVEGRQDGETPRASSPELETTMHGRLHSPSRQFHATWAHFAVRSGWESSQVKFASVLGGQSVEPGATVVENRSAALPCVTAERVVELGSASPQLATPSFSRFASRGDGEPETEKWESASDRGGESSNYGLT